MNERPLWVPTAERIAAAPMTAFMKDASAVANRTLDNYRALHRWSVEEPEAFWDLTWDWCGVIGEKGARVLVDDGRMQDARFFPDARLNYAENLLRSSGSGEAIVFRGENQIEIRWSWDQLRDRVSQIQQLFVTLGISAGDRVAAVVPNVPDTVACMLAATSLGAVWSSCSPDFGPQAILDRFGQIEPVVLIAVDGYLYGGKRVDVSAQIRQVAESLPGLRATLIIDYLGHARETADAIPEAAALDDAISAYDPAPIEFKRLPFSHPLYILFSSGTTGVPKCIVHSAGGALLQHLKEQRLHCGVVPGDRFFWFTTCGWMMWNWLVSNLASEATLLLYDGSPGHPDLNAIFDYAQAERMTIFGTSAKFIDSVRKAGIAPIRTHDLSSVKAILSTASPLSPDGFRYVYANIKSDVHLASVSGGTDIVASFVSSVPSAPVYAGELQGPALGMAVDVWDESGQPTVERKGELVCTVAFPSMPVFFWNDPDGAKYRSAYFDRFDNVWCHGDFAEWTSNGGMIIHGRSDATLNPGGVRIGTAEIYNQVERLPQVVEALCIGQQWQDDTRVVLFVRLAPGVLLDQGLEKAIRDQIRSGTSPRHVPARIIEIADIPRTKSGKITELAVRDVVHGREVKNRDALINPDALDLYKDLPQLRS